MIKFIYSEKATKFCKILTVDGTTENKSMVEISLNFVAFSEYINFTIALDFQIKFNTYLIQDFLRHSLVNVQGRLFWESRAFTFNI